MKTITREQELKKLAKIGRRLEGVTITLPSRSEINEILSETKAVFNGRIYFSYARNIAIGIVFSQTAHHIICGTSLAEDIIKGKKIFLNMYR